MNKKDEGSIDYMLSSLKNLVIRIHNGVENVFTNGRNMASPLFAVLTLVIVIGIFALLGTAIQKYETANDQQNRVNEIYAMIAQWKANAADNLFNFSVTEHKDGSFTTVYTSSSNKTGKIKEECSVSFPAGWGYGNKSLMALLKEKEEGKDLKDYDIYRIFYKKTNKGVPEEYLLYEYAPLLSFGPEEAERTEQLKKWEIERRKDPLVETAYYTTIQKTNAEVLDVKYKDKNSTIIRHDIQLITPVRLGYNAIYQSPYGKDEDLGYILNNSVCYKY